MKVRVSSLLATFAAVFLMALSAQAQEELPVLEPPDNNHKELNFDEDKILLYDRSSHVGQAKDTVQYSSRVSATTHSAKAPKSESHKVNIKEREGEDALSYNFLYYMFQKFKMSDLVGH
jgi:hypothetical protein